MVRKRLSEILCLFLICEATGWSQVKGQKEALFLPTGSMVPATVINSVTSFNVDTPLVAELSGPATFNGKEVLPNKTKFIGRALVLKSASRINAVFDLIVLPDGREMQVSALALSPDGSAGLVGKVEKRKDSLVASAALRGAVLGAAGVAGAGLNPVVAEAGQATAQEAVKEIDLSREQVDTSISIPSFTRCLVYLSRRLELYPERKEDTGGN